MELSGDIAQEIRQAWHRYLQRTERLRPDLHCYCRALTGQCGTRRTKGDFMEPT